jgi:hypothetical protein
MYRRIDVLGPTYPNSCNHLLSTVFIVRRRQLRGLTESADQLLERFVLRFRLARLMTGAQDCHSWAFNIGSNGPLVEVQEGDEGEAILSSRMVASLYGSGSMRSFPDTETNRERERGEGIRIPNWLSGQSSKLAQIWAPSRGQDSEIDPCLAWV